MKDFVFRNWHYIIDVVLCAVGLVALVVYLLQKREEKRTAATLIIGQIDMIEKRVYVLKTDAQLNNISLYHSGVIIDENMWSKYKHLFAKTLTRAEHDLVQSYFDCAEQLERGRKDIVTMLLTTWKDKSLWIQKEAIEIVRGKDENSEAHVELLTKRFSEIPIIFTPMLITDSLMRGLSNYKTLYGTTAYKKLNKFSYRK